MKEEGAVLVAYRLALTELNIPFTEDDLAAGERQQAGRLPGAGSPSRPAEQAAVAEKALAAFEDALRREYESGPGPRDRGAGQAVAALRKGRIKVALTSGFERGVVDLLVRRLGWSDLFDRVYASDDARPGRPAPYLIYQAMMDLRVFHVGRVAVIGDTPLDLQAASNARRAGWSACSAARTGSRRSAPRPTPTCCPRSRASRSWRLRALRRRCDGPPRL